MKEDINRLNVNIGVQCLCVKPELVRGIPNYTIQLLKALKNRRSNQYNVSFFDYQRQRGNEANVSKNLNGIIAQNDIYECNDMDFRSIMRGIRESDKSVYENKTYGEFFSIQPDLYHLPESAWIPQNFEAPVVVTVHDVISLLPQFESYFQEAYRHESRASLKFAVENKYEIIAISENTKRDVLTLFGGDEEHIHVIPNGFSSELFYPDKTEDVIKGLGVTKPYILYLGALDPRKGIRDVVDAFEMIEGSADLQLVIAGNLETQHKDKLSDVMDKIRKNDDIITTGYVTDAEKRVLMSCAEVFLFPSEYEGFGLPVIEAMACGTPVITTNISSLPEAGGDAALYVNSGDAEAIVDKVLSVLNDSEYKAQIIQKGFEHCKKFSWDKTAEMVEEVYKTAMVR